MRLFDVRLTVLNVDIFVRAFTQRLACFYWFTLALNTRRGSAEISLLTRVGRLILALHFFRWARIFYLA